MQPNLTLRSVRHLALVGIVAWGLHFFLAHSRDASAEVLKYLHISYGFLYFLGAGLLALTIFIFKNDAAKGGMAYLVGSTIKMLLALVFLLPLIFQEHPNARAIAFNFIAAYFIFLIAEVVFALKVLRKSKDPKGSGKF